MEFVDKEIQEEYDELCLDEELLLDELMPIQNRLKEIEQNEERA